MNFLTSEELNNKFDEYLETDMNQVFECQIMPENFKSWLHEESFIENYDFWFENSETKEEKNFYGAFYFLKNGKKHYFEFTLYVWNCELEIKIGD